MRKQKTEEEIPKLLLLPYLLVGCLVAKSTLNLKFYFLHRQCSCRMCFVSSASSSGMYTVFGVQIQTDNRFV